MKSTVLKAWLLERLPAIVADCELRLTNDDELVVLLILDTAIPHENNDDTAMTERDVIARYRSETRDIRVQLGREISQEYGYAVSWGMRMNETTQFFTSNMKPVMTRLSIEERRVVDALIAANIVHTRSAALSYIVRVFAIEHEAWLAKLQQAVAQIEHVREELQPEQRPGPPTLEK